MSETRDETGMDVMEVFAHLERLGEESGVRVHIADYDPDTGRRGFGIGMHGAQKRFLHHPRPALVLGLESTDTLVDFEAFLNVPCVRYLELPFTQDEFQQQARSVCGTEIDTIALEGVRSSVTEDGLENIRRNVTHRLNGAILVTLNQVVATVRRLAKEVDSTTSADNVLVSSVTPLASSDEKVRASLAMLDREIDALDGICAENVSEALHVQRSRLKMASDNLSLFAKGIAAMACGEKGSESLDQLANIGAEVSRVFRETDSVFTRLSGGRRRM